MKTANLFTLLVTMYALACASAPTVEQVEGRALPTDLATVATTQTQWHVANTEHPVEDILASASQEDSSAAEAPTSAVSESDEGLQSHPQAACAGEFTRAMSAINAPAYQNQMVIRNATSLQDAVRRANRCRNDVVSTSFFVEGARLACAPYLVCDVP